MWDFDCANAETYQRNDRVKGWWNIKFSSKKLATTHIHFKKLFVSNITYFLNNK